MMKARVTFCLRIISIDNDQENPYEAVTEIEDNLLAALNAVNSEDDLNAPVFRETDYDALYDDGTVDCRITLTAMCDNLSNDLVERYRFILEEAEDSDSEIFYVDTVDDVYIELTLTFEYEDGTIEKYQKNS